MATVQQGGVRVCFFGEFLSVKVCVRVRVLLNKVHAFVVPRYVL